MTIGVKLKELRELNNFTQKQIAEYLDYDQSYITKLEKDERRLTVYALEELCDLYNCSEEYILDGEGTYLKPYYEYNTNTKNLEISTIAKMNKILRNLNLLSVPVLNDVSQAFNDVYNNLYQLTKEYNLGSIFLEQDIDSQYSYVFVIQIPKNYEYKQALKIWDKIISEIEQYCISRGYEKFFKNIQIILR